MNEYAEQMANSEDESKKRKKKLLLILLCLILAIGMLGGLMLAFFSDLVSGSTSVTAGTLDIEKGTEAIQQNDVAITSIGNGNGLVENFNPGDVVTITVPVKNLGSKSAWIRAEFTLDGTAATEASGAALPVYVFDGDLSQAEAKDAVGSTNLTVTYDSGTYSIADSTPAVINGNKTKADYEDETANVGGTTLYKAGVDENEGNMIYTLYFAPEAGNQWQAKGLTLAYDIQAIQYRNNPSPVWADVVALS
jgi:hypothetical protein